MEILNIKKGQMIAKRKSKVKEWYLIQEGTVIQKLGFAETALKKNAIVGILETDWFICDYVAGEDLTLAVIPCKNADDLKRILAANERYRSIFLHTAIEQRHKMFALYADLQVRVQQFHVFAQTMYHDYQAFCEQMQLDEQPFQQIDYLKMLEMQHKLEPWEINNSVSLVTKFLKDYLHLMERDESMSVGVIMEASAQMHRAVQGIEEMVKYLNYHKDILFAETENDLCYLYFDLAVRAAKRQLDITAIKKGIAYLVGFIRKFKLYDQNLVEQRVQKLETYDFGNVQSVEVAQGMDVVSEDCLKHILEYALVSKEEMDDICKKVETYRNLPDMMSTDTGAYQLRKQLAVIFYDVYFKVFMQAVKNESTMTPIIEMFLNFGFMDVQMAGEENAKDLYNLTGRLRQFQSEHVYTIFEWLKNIYNGKKEPSKNEFDLDYPAYLLEQRKSGDLTEAQVKALQSDQKAKVRFEIQNMFASANRITCGKVTTFCPILNEYDLINSIEKMAVTVDRLEAALNQIRMVDFSAFYREVNFTSPGLEIMTHEKIMLEVLPDMILMPNAGTRSMMWQETADKRRDTPARFLFPIFTAADVEGMMVEAVGRFRWEMCRKIQGVRWNDVREKSLTSEYCDYIQFYRKNHDLSVDAKEKLKTAIVRAKNNYREVFVKDYENWVKYECNGSFRLNKVAREILIQYCPFTKKIRDSLKSNPVFQNAFAKIERENGKKRQRINALYDKYQKAGGEITPLMKDNLMFYEM